MKTMSVPVLEYTDRTPADVATAAAQHGHNKAFAPYRGQLKITVYVNSGLLTVHVVAGRHLRSAIDKKLCNSYVKLALIPDETKRTKCKTEIKANTNMPTFDEKFSFELFASDSRRRLVISLWNKHSNDRHCELLGCMSFGIRHIIQQKKDQINGWYFLLHENLGKRKHLHVREHKLDESSLYMDMQGIDVPGVHSEEDSGLDAGMDRPTSRRHLESMKKVHLGSGALFEARADVLHSPEPFVPSPSIAIVHHASNDQLAMLKETIQEQRAAIGMLKDKLSERDLPSPLSHRSHSPMQRTSSPHRPAFVASPISRHHTPLPIVSSHPNRDISRLQEEEVRCPVHDHEPTCPMAAAAGAGAASFVNPLREDTSFSSDESSSPSSQTEETATTTADGRLQFELDRGEHGFGFTLTGDRPAHVHNIMPHSPADRACIHSGDAIISIDDHDVSNLSSDTVARVIRHCSNRIKLQIRRSSKNSHNSAGFTPRPCPPLRSVSKMSPLLTDTHSRQSALQTGSPQHGSLESRSRTSEGDSFGTSEMDGDNSYIDMRAHWAMMMMK